MFRNNTFVGVLAVTSGIIQTRPALSTTKSFWVSPGAEHMLFGELNVKPGNASATPHSVAGGVAGRRTKSESNRAAEVKLIVTVALEEGGPPGPLKR